MYRALLYPLLLLPLQILNNHVSAQQTTIIIATTTIQPAASSTSSSSSYTFDSDFKSEILDNTNRYRQQHNASALTWNSTLAEYAKKWAAQCKWEHSHGLYGENIAEGYPNVTAIVGAWANESRSYDYSAPTGFSEETGHFTQLVWKATQQVGCAVENCGSDNGSGNDDDDSAATGWFVVCEYYPPGNVEGDGNALFKSNVLPGDEDSGGDGMRALLKTTAAVLIAALVALLVEVI